MAFDKNNTTTFQKVVIIIFAVILIVSLCLPFFSSCSTGGQSTSDTSEQDDSSTTQTVADVDADYQTLIDSLDERLASASSGASLAAVANLGNAYMDWGVDLQQASDASDNEDHVKEVFAQAVEYYDQYLEQDPTSNAVSVDRAICLYYSGDEQGAISELESFVLTNPDFSPAWANLGIFYEDQGMNDEARNAYNQAIAADEVESYNVSTYAQLRLAIMDAIEAANSASSSLDAASSSSAATDASSAADTSAAAEASSLGADGSATSVSAALDGSDGAADGLSADEDGVVSSASGQ